jgi:hypothetical protein
MLPRSSRTSADVVQSLEHDENATILRRSGFILPETTLHGILYAIR